MSAPERGFESEPVVEGVPPADKASRVRQMFGLITPRYDLLNTVLSVGLDRSWRRRVVAMSGLEPGGRAVDLCTGTGELAVLLARRVGPGGQVRGLDFCEEMLVRAREKFSPEAWPQLRFEQGDALSLPLEDGAWQAATMAFGLRNLADPARGFREMQRVLAPGGRALVLELTRPSGCLGALYSPYLFGWLPLMGGLFSRHRDAYRYLARSIAEFLSTNEVCRLMRETGFENVGMVPLLGGVATIFHGTSPKSWSR